MCSEDTLFHKKILSLNSGDMWCEKKIILPKEPLNIRHGLQFKIVNFIEMHIRELDKVCLEEVFRRIKQVRKQ